MSIITIILTILAFAFNIAAYAAMDSTVVVNGVERFSIRKTVIFAIISGVFFLVSGLSAIYL